MHTPNENETTFRNTSFLFIEYDVFPSKRAVLWIVIFAFSL